MLHIALLGPTQIRREGAELPPPPGMQRGLLGLLALAGGRAVTVEALIDGLWGESPPESVRNTLQVHVSSLRRKLGADIIRTMPAGYFLGEGVTCDAVEFERGVATGLQQRRNPSVASSTLRTALAVWRGRPLADIQAPFVERERPRLEELRLGAMEAYADAELALGHADLLIASLEQVVAEHPLRELPWAQLITALDRSGRQGDALATYRRVRRVLRDELGADPGEAIQRAHADVLGGRPPAEPLPRSAQPPTPRTPMVGRTHDMASVREQLADPNVRMVTVLGPGGVGKTRLAAEIAHKESETNRLHAGQVAWVALVSVPDASGLPRWVGQRLGLAAGGSYDASAEVVEALANRTMLLVLDNLEHLLPSAGEWLGALLDACPRVSVLATSRTAARVLGERRYPLEGLSVERDGSELSPAATLLIQCAEAVRPGWVTDQADLESANELAADLEGLPLSLELTAARASTLGPRALRKRLRGRAAQLSGHGQDIDLRHRSLQATFAWSYDLLNLDTRRVLDQLSVFSGLVPVDAAAAVTELTEDELLDHVAALVDASLLRPADHDPPAFTMLATVRACAQELAARDEQAAASARHAHWYAALAQRSAPHLWLHDQRQWFDRLEGDYDNLRAALEKLLTVGGDQALVLATNLAPLWEARGYLDDGLRWLQRALDATPNAGPATRARAMFVASRIAEQQGELESEYELLVGSRELYEQVDELPGLIFTLSHLGLAAAGGDDEAANDNGARSIALAREMADPWYVAMALNNHGFHQLERGDLSEQTAALLEESLSLRRELGEPRGLAVTLGSVAELNLVRGDYQAAELLLEEMLSAARSISHTELTCIALNLQGFRSLFGDDVDAANFRFSHSLQQAVDAGHRRLTAEALLGLSAVASLREMPTRALRLCVAAVAVESPDGQPLSALHQQAVQMVSARTVHLDETTRNSLTRAAREAPLDRVVTEALRG